MSDTKTAAGLELLLHATFYTVGYDPETRNAFVAAVVSPEIRAAAIASPELTPYLFDRKDHPDALLLRADPAVHSLLHTLDRGVKRNQLLNALEQAQKAVPLEARDAFAALLDKACFHPAFAPALNGENLAMVIVTGLSEQENADLRRLAPEGLHCSVAETALGQLVAIHPGGLSDEVLAALPIRNETRSALASTRDTAQSAKLTDAQHVKLALKDRDTLAALLDSAQFDGNSVMSRLQIEVMDNFAHVRTEANARFDAKSKTPGGLVSISPEEAHELFGDYTQATQPIIPASANPVIRVTGLSQTHLHALQRLLPQGALRFSAGKLEEGYLDATQVGNAWLEQLPIRPETRMAITAARDTAVMRWNELCFTL